MQHHDVASTLSRRINVMCPLGSLYCPCIVSGPFFTHSIFFFILFYFPGRKSNSEETLVDTGSISAEEIAATEQKCHTCKFPYTLQPLYNTVHYNTSLDITWFKDGSQKCIDYIEK